MRTLTAGLVTIGLVALVGCNTSPPGGSGGSRGTAGTAGNTSSSATFKIKAPATSTTLKQGENHEVKITLDRGRDFKDDVTLKFEPDKGLKVEPAEKVVKAGDPEEVAINVSADKDAPVGDLTVKVIGTPKSGSMTAVEFKVKVEKSGG
jgi:uncharacterized membrane protein